MRSLRLGRFVFDGGLGRSKWTLAGASGLSVDGVEMDRERIKRPGAHGAFTLPGYLEERESSWWGLLLTDTAEEQEHELRSLSGLLAGGGTDRLHVDGAGVLWLDVARRDAPEKQILVPGRVASYRFHAVAADPRMFGETRTVAAGVPAFNFGNFPARPELVVSGGSAGGYTVTGPGGRRVVVVKPLVVGAPHTIDFARGGLYVGGVRQLRAITVYEPWEVVPGGSAVATVSNGVQLAMKVTDTFV